MGTGSNCGEAEMGEEGMERVGSGHGEGWLGVGVWGRKVGRGRGMGWQGWLGVGWGRWVRVEGGGTVGNMSPLRSL